MKKCILVPDSFKGTMKSIEVCEIMKNSILQSSPQCKVVAIPVADGGEGTVDCFLQALGGEKVFIQTRGPLGEITDSFYGKIGELAIIEMAASAGFSLAKGRLNPLKTTTFGVGELIRDAIHCGCTSIVLGLGGSCTNDAGVGMAVALGAKFFDKDNKEFLPVGGDLGRIASMNLTEIRKLVEKTRIVALCDIDNPLFGENGAAYVFGPQKGASPDQVVALDRQLRLFSDVVYNTIGIDISKIKGGAAAGGMGAGVYAFLGGELKRGIDTVLDLVGFETLLTGCDYVFTGEGRLDSQSLSGKVVVGVANRAHAKGVPVIAVVGELEDELLDVFSQGITKVYETSAFRKSEDEIKAYCREDLDSTMKKILADQINK